MPGDGKERRARNWRWHGDGSWEGDDQGERRQRQERISRDAVDDRSEEAVVGRRGRVVQLVRGSGCSGCEVWCILRSVLNRGGC